MDKPNESPKRIWKIPVVVSVETETQSKARLVIQNQLGANSKVRGYLFDKGRQEELATFWRPISTAPKDRQILGYEADIRHAYSAQWAGDGWLNLVSNEKALRITHWMDQPSDAALENQ